MICGALAWRTSQGCIAVVLSALAILLGCCGIRITG
jgi:hypothetical protein